jgi:hypothetical protein
VPSQIVLECFRRSPASTYLIMRQGQWLTGRLLGEALPTVYLAHRDLARSQQGPERHRGSFRGRQHALGLDPPLELRAARSLSTCGSIFHWLLGKLRPGFQGIEPKEKRSFGPRPPSRLCYPFSWRDSATLRRFSAFRGSNATRIARKAHLPARGQAMK